MTDRLVERPLTRPSPCRRESAGRGKTDKLGGVLANLMHGAGFTVRLAEVVTGVRDVHGLRNKIGSRAR